jgi:transcriptional regulator with XRE-family HTH domain
MRCDGRTLARLRKELGISQQDLAQKAKLSKTTIERAERGVAVGYQSIHEIAAVLDVGIRELVLPDEEAGLEANLIPLRPVDDARELVELFLRCDRCDFDLLDQPVPDRLEAVIGAIRRLEGFFPGHDDVAPVHARWRRSLAERLSAQEDVSSCLTELAATDLHLLA